MAGILVIDDDAQLRRLLGRVLKGAGYTVHEAKSGREGIDLFGRTHPALVITDLVMPDKEGIETIRELRQTAPTVPILAISGSDNHPIYLHAATRLGATEALDKPFGNEELLAIVTRLLKTTGGPFAD
jgi:DNA-binding response OmpR family regulator